MISRNLNYLYHLNGECMPKCKSKPDPVVEAPKEDKPTRIYEPPKYYPGSLFDEVVVEDNSPPWETDPA